MAWKLTDSDVAMLRKMAARERRLNPPIGGRDIKQPRMMVPRVSDIKFGKANGDIIPDTITGSVIVWDDTGNPPTVVSPTEQIDDVHYVWLSDEQVSDGKEVAIVKLGEFWHLLFAECEDPEEKQTGN